MDEIKIPYVHEDIVEYLDNLFAFDSLLSALDGENAEYQIGYMKGARDIINHLRSVAKEQNER